MKFSFEELCSIYDSCLEEAKSKLPNPNLFSYPEFHSYAAIKELDGEFLSDFSKYLLSPEVKDTCSILETNPRFLMFIFKKKRPLGNSGLYHWELSK